MLDLKTEAGGLTPVRQVGRNQTAGLALSGGDGKSYTFRGIDKDPTAVLPDELLGTPIVDLAQDQISSNFPAADVAAGPIGRAAGLNVVQTRIVVMPDVPELGAFRETFGGLVGTLSEFPTVEGGAFGSEEIIGGPEMIERITASPADRIDARAFALVRLVDQLLGDWDRHIEQWRWARIPGNPLWQPIVEDRDQAFSRYDGLAMTMQKDKDPKFDRFGPSYPPLEGLTWNGRTVDRWLLAGLDEEAWVEVARELQSVLTDSIFDDALARLPDEFQRLRGAQLRAGLRGRRDGLVGQARRFYRYLGEEADVRATNAADWVHIDRRADDTLAVFLRASDPSAGPAYFERVYHPDDTEEVRIYTGAGDDRVTVDTAGGTSIAVRLVCGAGENIVELNAGASTLRCGLAPVGSSGPGREVADRIWLSPGEPIEEIGTPFRSQGLPLKLRRDWGSTRYGQPWFAVGPGIGLFGGFGLTWETFDFRKRPYGKQQRLRAGFATGALRPRFDYSGIFRRENRESHIEVHALASGIETLNFFGVGNETPGQSNETFRRSKRVAAEVEVRSVWSIGSNAVVYTGPVVRYSSTEDADDDPRLINLLRPYGVDDMGQVGWGVGLHFNNRRPASLFEPKDSDDIMRVREALVGRDQTADIDARYYPDVWDLEGDYAVVRGEVSSSHWAGGSGPGFGVGVGGQVTEGDVPYYDLAYLGAQQVRGLARGRFAGDSSLFVNARFAIPVGRLNLVVPGHWGLFAGGDTGRVWADGEQSDTWHYGYGGGVWWTPWDYSTAVRVHAANSDDGFHVYVVFGFGY